MKSHVEVEIAGSAPLLEHLVGILSQIGFEGFWEDGKLLKCYMESSRWSPTLHEEVLSLVSLVARSSSTPTPYVMIRTLEDRNWNEEWEKTIRPIRVSERITITPSWHSVEPVEGQIVLTIDPKMAFGTGYHESTRLILRLLERHIRKGMKVLDVGTGTGVLAIAALRLGASAAVGIDTDDWAYSNAGENARLNGVANNLLVMKGEITTVADRKFDMILANIQRDVIERLLDDMGSRLNDEGVLLLSGLLESDREPLMEMLQTRQWEVMEEIQENEWIALAVRRA